MFNNFLPDSSLFCCISLLCLPHCLSAHMTCAICSSTFYPLCAMSIHCTVPLLSHSAAALSPFFTHESPSTTVTTTTPINRNSISSVPCTYSFCAICACNAHNASACSLCTKFLHNSSALSDHHRDSSASLVVQPMCLSSLGVMPRFLFLSR
jgi:hypothetical protein